ncbi:Acid-sensing ion channel 1C [Holothuria leucospilota]|uniref:Acid-sensing ion channel 1C n=1 Tax=Holothuria leucospilota TaxID=206669 RepID=A0A9Q1BJG4_HOLLE|nr:Acid-sensing ion channel 1C [Holothuria leucospilota]
MAIWLICAIGAGFKKFLDFPVSTVIEFIFVKSLPFPAITICNYNQFRKSEVFKQDPVLQDILYYFATNDNDFKIDWDRYDELYGDSPWNLTQTAIESGHQLESMLINCRWNRGENCGPQNFTTKITGFGVCFTFNDNFKPGKRLHVTEAGQSQGLRLILSTEQDNYFWGDYLGAGFKVFAHSPGAYPLVNEFGISVTPGFETSIALKSTITKTLSYPYKANCSDVQLKYTGEYSSERCFFECHVEYISKQCGCRYYKFPGSERLCDPKEIALCVKPAIRDTAVFTSPCECPVSCRYESYSSKISLAKWPSEFAVSKTASHYNVTEDTVRNNYLEINIFFDAPGYEEIRQVPIYTFLDLQSDIGAYMGLLLGASIISLFEVFDCVMALASQRYRRPPTS